MSIGDGQGQKDEPDAGVQTVAARLDGHDVAPEQVADDEEHHVLEELDRRVLEREVEEIR